MPTSVPEAAATAAPSWAAAWAMRWLALAVAIFVPLAVAHWRGKGALSKRAAAAVALGTAAGVPLAFVERTLLRWLDPTSPAGVPADLLGLAFDLLVGSPLRHGLALGLFALVFQRALSPRQVLGLAGAGAFALSASFHVTRGWLLPPSDPLLLDFARLAFDAMAFAFTACVWAWPIHRAGRVRGHSFERAWLGATVAYGIASHVVCHRSAQAALSGVPLGITMLLVGWLAARDPSLGLPQTRGGRAPPSIFTMAEAIRRTDRPVALGWVLAGSLVNTGVITAAFVLALVVGARLGLDFSAIDSTEAGSLATAPLALLSGSVLASFPVSGFLVARAAAAHTVLEAALSTGTALVAILLLLGLAAPVAVLLALAFAPLAFGLSCLGAWAGLER